MSQEKKVFKTEWAGRSLTIETGQLAKQEKIIGKGGKF